MEIIEGARVVAMETLRGPLEFKSDGFCRVYLFCVRFLLSSLTNLLEENILEGIFKDHFRKRK